MNNVFNREGNSKGLKSTANISYFSLFLLGQLGRKNKDFWKGTLFFFSALPRTTLREGTKASHFSNSFKQLQVHSFSPEQG